MVGKPCIKGTRIPVEQVCRTCRGNCRHSGCASTSNSCYIQPRRSMLLM
ncbi:MAG: DUF433 domain-containing protein [Anaerolineae bacterium]